MFPGVRQAIWEPRPHPTGALVPELPPQLLTSPHPLPLHQALAPDSALAPHLVGDGGELTSPRVCPALGLSASPAGPARGAREAGASGCAE